MPIDGTSQDRVAPASTKYILTVMSGMATMDYHSVKVSSQCPEIDPQWTQEYGPSATRSGICWHAKDFVNTSKVEADAGETIWVHTMVYDALTNDPMFSRCFYNHLRI